MTTRTPDFTGLDGLPKASARLLVVDDQTINIQIMHQALSSSYQVFMATSGRQALEICEANPPDLILLDVEMSGMNGIQVCEKLKANSLTRDIPVIFVTAHSDPEDEAHGLEVGAVDFISKPINPSILRARVKTHLTLKHQADLLRDMARHDGLTGVFNRRHFDETIGLECRRASRAHTPLALIMLDVDYFKRFNDTYGHQVGDDCLQRVAQGLNALVNRASDVFARYGGEEFACVLPGANEVAAMDMAQRMGDAVKKLAIPHAGSDVASTVTISLGIALFDGSAPASPETLVALADAQLYRAKRMGRARACLDTLGAKPEASPEITTPDAGA